MLKRFFTNSLTFKIASIAALIMFLAITAIGILFGGTTITEIITAICEVFLIIGGMYAYKIKDYTLLSGLVSGILFTFFYTRMNYICITLIPAGREEILSWGFMGCLYIALNYMAVFVNVLLIFNHYGIKVNGYNSNTKIVVNRLIIFVLLVIYVLSFVTELSFGESFLTNLYSSISYMIYFLIGIIVACCETVLAYSGVQGEENENQK